MCIARYVEYMNITTGVPCKLMINISVGLTNCLGFLYLTKILQLYSLGKNGMSLIMNSSTTGHGTRMRILEVGN